MNAQTIINNIASQADDLLQGYSRSEAPERVIELIKQQHPGTSTPDARKLALQIITILEDEDFFATNRDGDSTDDDDDGDSTTDSD